MAILRPFQGILPNNKLAQSVSCPPYDVISSKEAQLMAKDNPNSFLRIIKPEINSNEVNSITDIHQYASNLLKDFIKNGILKKDLNNCFYLYQIKMGDHEQTGIIAATSINEYNQNKIKKHEYTRPDKENDRTQHIKITQTNTGPVFLTFKNDGHYSNIIKNVQDYRPYINFEAEDNTEHTIWRINDLEKQNQIIDYFQSISNLYIADGHHRAASAARVQNYFQNKNPKHKGNEPYNFFLSVIFPDNEMKILDYNRIIKDLNGLSEKQLINLIKKNFFISRIDKNKPTKINNFSMLLNNNWYNLESKRNILCNDPVDSLDASILQNYLLEPILGIDNPRTNKRIDFIGGIRGLEELERRCNTDAAIAFALYPVSINDLFCVADANKVMPPKSTWFEPKLRSGLVVRSIKGND
tara:strand:+ start:3463 stop:4698 length:1236 start_codon:yes stop_codon:yes gene_type:complete